MTAGGPRGRARDPDQEGVPGAAPQPARRHCFVVFHPPWTSICSSASSRRLFSTAIRKVKHHGVTGEIEFDGKGDRKKALYFVLQVVSDNPEKWGDNKIVKQLTIAAPAAKK